MTPIKNILLRIQNFNGHFSEKNLEPEYKHAWELNKHHGINLNPLSPFSAFILRYLLKKEKPQTVLEIGTSGGYSAITMANTTPYAHIHTIEKSAPKAEIARVHIKESGLQNIELYESDATQIIQSWSKPIDVLFLDADRKNYLNFLKQLESHLTPHALVIADNVKSHPDDVLTLLRMPW
jgi:predicted O-methyltransferase YrrM